MVVKTFFSFIYFVSTILIITACSQRNENNNEVSNQMNSEKYIYVIREMEYNLLDDVSNVKKMDNLLERIHSKGKLSTKDYFNIPWSPDYIVWKHSMHSKTKPIKMYLIISDGNIKLIKDNKINSFKVINKDMLAEFEEILKTTKELKSYNEVIIEN